jgi:hypothetical protein
MNRTKSALLLATALATALTACGAPVTSSKRIVERPELGEAAPIRTPDRRNELSPEPATTLTEAPQPVEPAVEYPVEPEVVSIPVVEEPVVEEPVVAAATCETAALQAVAVLNPATYTAEDVVEECVRDSWSQELIACYTNANDIDTMSPCATLYEKEFSAARFRALNIKLDAKADADQCYAQGDGFASHCVAACNDGFPAACVVLAALSDEDTAKRALQRSCNVAEEIGYATPADLPFTTDERKAELQAGHEACRILAEPLLTGAVTGDANLWVHAEQACVIGVKLGDGTAATSCLAYGDIADAYGSYDTADWAYDHACIAGSAAACDMLDFYYWGW